MRRRKCRGCKELFLPRAQTVGQKFCSKNECQRERKTRWQAKKRSKDPDYRANETAARKVWAKENPDYWMNYRENHPESTERNRIKQKQRNQGRSVPPEDIESFPVTYEPQKIINLNGRIYRRLNDPEPLADNRSRASPKNRFANINEDAWMPQGTGKQKVRYE